MKAIVQDKYGSTRGPGSSGTIDKPDVGDDDVLLRVHAAGVHIGDWHLMAGLPYLIRIMGFGLRAPKARVRGTDVAGTVEAVGKNVMKFQPGDEVFGTCDGSFAEYALCPREQAGAQARPTSPLSRRAVVPSLRLYRPSKSSRRKDPARSVSPDCRRLWGSGDVRGPDRESRSVRK